MKFLRRCALLALLVLPTLARAADIDGAALALWWGVPFAGLLLSIALKSLRNSASTKAWKPSPTACAMATRAS